jgi:hypothetical protein
MDKTARAPDRAASLSLVTGSEEDSCTRIRPRFDPGIQPYAEHRRNLQPLLKALGIEDHIAPVTQLLTYPRLLQHSQQRLLNLGVLEGSARCAGEGKREVRRMTRASEPCQASEIVGRDQLPHPFRQSHSVESRRFFLALAFLLDERSLLSFGLQEEFPRRKSAPT